MTLRQTIPLPKLGESILSATVVQWFKKVGDFVEKDAPLLEVSTDKVSSEIPSPYSGILTEILAPAGHELDVGAPLGSIGGSAEEVAVQASPKGPELACPYAKGDNPFLSPSVLRLLQEKGIPLSEVEKIPTTGEGGRLTKRDVEAFSMPLAAAEEDRIPMTPLRRAIAENMVRSFYEAPHASLFTEVDVTHLVSFIEQEKARFLAAHGVKLSITPFVAKSIATAALEFPLINASLEKETIIVKKSVNVGIAVSVDQGIMVPVIRGCQALSLPAIAKEVQTLAHKARTNSLSPTDVKEGTITLTNFGITGVMMGTPIIRHPEVAILGLGAIQSKVVVTKDNAIAIRKVAMVSLTFDHRVLDGLYGCAFLNRIKQELEKQPLTYA